MKLLRRLLLLVVLPLAVLVGLFLMRDGFLATVIAKAGTHALGVRTEVASVSTSLTEGRFEVAGLSAANPPGFSDQPLLSVAGFGTELPLTRLRDDPLVVEDLSVEGVVVRIERKGSQFNLEPIREHLQSLAGSDEGQPDQGGGEAPAPTGGEGEGSGGKAIVLRRVNIDGAKLILDLGAPWLEPRSVAMGQIVLTDIEASGDEALAKVMGQVLEQLLDEALGMVGDLPPELLPILDSLRAGLQDGFQGEDLQATLDAAMGQLEGVGQEAFDAAVNDAVDQGKAELQKQAEELLGNQSNELLQGAGQQATEKLGGLLDGLKKKKDGN
ncbi:hypothetical protein [Engelhardtia mirabilis]|uniref:AsmA family protein n=1 Tax=Engelhardtia mirabilis TaxID=2528011 RepID=A0A518BLN4_9BACT|nr:hypothetical protein Pla133_29770 [Planctomycetes bacterium Pla133]QDV02214.1 hypothetical protein Pla86_29760 [Planctomycetes bacterium Pla86]